MPWCGGAAQAVYLAQSSSGDGWAAVSVFLFVLSLWSQCPQGANLGGHVCPQSSLKLGQMSANPQRFSDTPQKKICAFGTASVLPVNNCWVPQYTPPARCTTNHDATHAPRAVVATHAVQCAPHTAPRIALFLLGAFTRALLALERADSPRAFDSLLADTMTAQAPKPSGHGVRTGPSRGPEPRTICPQKIYGQGHNVRIRPQKKANGSLRTQKENTGCG